MSDDRPVSIVNIVVIRGVEGPSLYINNFRVAGNKPWGGGDVIAEWNVADDDLRNDLASARVIP